MRITYSFFLKKRKEKVKLLCDCVYVALSEFVQHKWEMDHNA